ncbi:sensor histidine kinase [Deinococcus roseus]|uniref:histidine kinase n=1 Tax=Deinococcus roseus TaxID=392414 RepID=A0ABQ2DB72_9DEIO|nr:PAS domain-containing sensor histidine kinase [Deinococcus roseus]GGJ52336.1 hypothetical protein GCM10008938_42930 [Deinococcus roseus]
MTPSPPDDHSLKTAALAASLDAIVTIDQQGRVVNWNPAAERTFGYLQAEALDQPMVDLIVPPEMRESHLKGFQRYLDTRVAHIVGQRVEVPALRKDGSQFPCEVSFHPIHLSSGIYFTAYLRDLSERKVFEERQRENERKLQDLSEAQTRFVMEVSHEIKTPLTGILGNLEVLLKFPHIPPEEKQEMLQDCYRETLRLGRLVSDLLGLTRGTRVQMMEDEVPLDQLVLDAARDLQHSRGNVTLTVGHLDSCWVLGDSDRLKQLLIILVGNAFKYTPTGGEVTVKLQAESGFVVLKVSDTGVGIPAEDLQRVFDRFYRSALKEDQDPGGSGLGLSIAQWIVEGHGGQIWLESRVGEGTTAVVKLPSMS